MAYRIPIAQKIMPGHLIELDQQGPYDHYFGGEQHLEGGECPYCMKPLMLHLTLDTADPRLNLGSIGVDRLRLLFCARCGIQEDLFVYRIHDDEEIEILEYEPGAPNITQEYQQYWYEEWGFSDAFPRRPITLTPMPPRLQDLIDLRIQVLQERGIDKSITQRLEIEAEMMELAGVARPPDLPQAIGFNQVGGFGFIWRSAALPGMCTICAKLGLDHEVGFLAVLVNSALPQWNPPKNTPYPLKYDFAVIDNSRQIVFGICTHCNAVHAIAAI